MMGCFVYFQRVADEHPGVRGATGRGPLCIRCGLPRGTWEWESADDAHKAETGHHLGSGACEDAGHDERAVIDAWREASS